MDANSSTNSFTIHTDGGARGNPGPAAIGFVISTPAGQILHQHGQVIGHTTNNTAEYQAVIAALIWISANLSLDSHTHLQFFLDSNLVVHQILGDYKIKQPHLQALVDHIHQLLSDLGARYTFTHIPRSQNSRADLLVNQALDSR